jgi:hypothetical protein
MPTLEQLKGRAAEAHAAYSAKFAARQAAEETFGGVARRSESLRTAGDDSESKYGSTYASGLADCLDNPASVASTVASLGPLRDAVHLLRDAEAHFAAYTYADAKRKTLSARVDELAAHVDAESARLEHHEAALAEALRAASELEGGLSVQVSGGTADRLRELIAQLSGELTRARAALVQHDEDTARQRDQLENKE